MNPLRSEEAEVLLFDCAMERVHFVLPTFAKEDFVSRKL